MSTSLQPRPAFDGTSLVLANEQASGMSRNSYGKRPTAAGIFRSLICGFFLAGCSPYGFGPEISSFATSVGNLQTADKAGKARLDAERTELDMLVWTARADGSLRTIDCSVGQRGCSVVASVKTDADKTLLKARTAVDQARNNSTVSLKALLSYSQALEAIANADDAVELGAAQDRFNSALTGTFQTAGSSVPVAKLNPILNFFAALTTTTLNRARFRALRNATERAHDNVIQLGSILGPELNRVRNARMVELRAQTVQLRDALNRLSECGNRVGCGGISTNDVYGLYGGHMIALASVTQRIAALQAQDGEVVGSSMIAAHAKLRDAVAKAADDPAEVFSAIREFKELAQEIVTAFQS